MSEQSGYSVAAIRARQAALAQQASTIAEADRVLGDTFANAHAGMRDSVRQLDVIAAEIDRAVVDQAELGVDAPLGAREFQRFLIVKQREIEAVVAGAREVDRAKSAVLEQLRAHYADFVG